jgi:thiol-disulfide isomerase/thioredoxin
LRCFVKALSLVLVLCSVTVADARELGTDFRLFAGRDAVARFALEDLTGKKRTLADYSDRVLVVNFWASWCSSCMAEFPTLQVMRAELAGERFELLAVNVGEDRLTAKRFLDGLIPGFSFPVLLDENMLTTRQWRVRALPTSFIVDPQGRIAFFAEGGRNFASPEVVDRLRTLMPTNQAEAPAAGRDDD